MAFDPRNPNLALFASLEPTDPAYTKPITGKAFKGTALNGEYVVKRLTDAFGPVGMGWGYDATFEDVHFPTGRSLNFCTLRFWYHPNGCTGSVGSTTAPLTPIGPRAEFTQVGGTELAGARKSGDTYADDEARKKSITDALLKAASHIGIGADIHLGMFDDNKYVAARAADEAKENAAVARQLAEDVIKEASDLALQMDDATDPVALNDLLAMAREAHARLREMNLPDAAKTLAASVKANMTRLGIASPAPAAKAA